MGLGFSTSRRPTVAQISVQAFVFQSRTEAVVELVESLQAFCRGLEEMRPGRRWPRNRLHLRIVATSRPETRKPSVYKPRHPEKTPFFAVLYHHFDEFKAAYEERFQKEYGRCRAVIDKVVGKYFQCGVFLGGFGRLKCPKCGAEKLLALSCKTRAFCPSCSTKRALLWAEFVQERVLKPVPHRHVVFTLPKMLRPYFKFHRDLLPVLCHGAWDSLREFFEASLSKCALPGAIHTINTV